MVALVILNSELPPKRLYVGELKRAALVLCADGGANRALAAGIQPDYVIGDLDSLNPLVRDAFDAKQLIHRPRQNATDLDKTLDFAIEMGAEAVSVLGCGGGRFDHQLTNLNILQKYSDRLEICCIDATGTGYFVRDRLHLTTPIGQQISLMAFTRASGITTHGLKWSLTDATLEWGVSDGQSNEAVAPAVDIRVTEGVLFVFCVGGSGR